MLTHKYYFTFLFALFACVCPYLQAQGTLLPVDSLSESILNNLPLPTSYKQALQLAEGYNTPQGRDTFLAYQKLALSFATLQRDEDKIMDCYSIINALYNAPDFLAERIRKTKELYNYIQRDSHLITIDLDIVNYSIRTGDYQQSRIYLDSAKQRIDLITSDALKSQYYQYEGTYSQIVENNYIEAVTFYQTARVLNVNDIKRAIRINHNLASIYSIIENHESCLELLLENQKLALAAKDSLAQIYSIYGLIESYGELGRYSDMYAVCKEALFIEKNKGQLNSFGFVYTKMGEYFRIQEKLDSAVFYVEKSIKLNKEQGEIILEQLAHIEMAYIQLSLNNLDKAAFHGEYALSLGTSTNNNAVDILASIYEQQGHYKKAYEMRTLDAKEQKRILEEQNNGQLITKLLEERYTQQKEERDRIHEAEKKQQRTYSLVSLLTAILLSILIILWVLVRSRSKLKKVNTSLQESNDALKQFAYITSHDLLEPIRNIISFSGLLNRSFKKANNILSEQRDYLHFVTSSAGVLKEIVDSLRGFIKASFEELHREEVILQEVYDEIKENLNDVISDKNGVLELIDISSSTKVVYSKSMLTLVLQNLISNGFKHNESPQPKVTVSVNTLPNSGKTQFKVSDNGIGIDSRYYETIFAPFKTLTNKSITQSSGLGLSISKTIVERYGGNISIQSDGSSSTTFTFTV